MDEQNGEPTENGKQDALESLGVEQEPESLKDGEAESLAKESDPYDVKKRLGQQAKKHQREMRAVQEQLMRLQQQMPQQSNESSYAPPMNQGGGNEDPIQKAVRFALQAREDQERKAKEAERMQHVAKQYQRMQNEFDKASDKYEDFDDVVRGDAPFTESIRDAMLLIDNPADVAYKLGKNRDELVRISQLHPLDQAREVNKLSFALMGGNTGNQAQNSLNRPMMSQSKPNPVSPSAATSAAQIRARMKSGNWK